MCTAACTAELQKANSKRAFLAKIAIQTMVTKSLPHRWRYIIVILSHTVQVRAEPGVVPAGTGVVAPNHPQCPPRLVCMDLVSLMIVPLGLPCSGVLPQAPLPQSGAV